MNTTNTAPAKFIVGQTYSCRSACDHNCVWSFTVTARTDKSVSLSGEFMNGVKAATKRIKVWDGQETVLPLGAYSMAPTLRA